MFQKILNKIRDSYKIEKVSDNRISGLFLIKKKLVFHFCKGFTVEEEASHHHACTRDLVQGGKVLVAASREAKYSNDYL
jgi:hypothetical protein